MRHRLVLVRHAKSSWDDASLADRDRPLTPRGLAALPLMRDHVAGIEGRLDLVLCSPARRTVDTLTGIRSALADGVHVETIEDLYGADVERLLRLVRSFADQRENAMIIGHNPGLGDLAALLAGSGEADALAQLHAKFPTGAIATLSFEGTWARLAPDAMQLDDLFTPRRPRP